MSEQPTNGTETPGAVVDLLGLLAYAELVAFFRLSEDASLAPTLADKAELAQLATVEFGHYTRIRDRLVELGAEPGAAMEPFTAAVDAFHAQTAPNDWLESLVKAYVGDGIAADFYRQVAELVDPGTRELVHEVLSNAGHSEFVVARVRAATENDPKIAGRLALWARRLVGEALGQAQRVAAERAELAGLLVGRVEGAGGDLAEIGRMFARLTESHTARMNALGLST
ncbi:ferritin-like fold-containing protein [Allonocardiopsis opalescens]|uniref:tRNA-(MS[2]IO[6]A)-hydroxylase MiaE-like protein n=1 Tax=Allonocardiopsis opalescens TaxID=1144618 RepID=A0A2T0QDN5_9ACTN|nr:ferritin-like fold-containing protein [Allonocardiopsis opalescens]PRY01981.1 tRNA-(MS[2]IO[6]A)-hydroxylase MiaE-like protein [Allonocardiopsis opalescens]